MRWVRRAVVVVLRLRGLVTGREQVGRELGRQLPADIPQRAVAAAAASLVVLLGLLGPAIAALVAAAAAEVEPAEQLASQPAGTGLVRRGAAARATAWFVVVA